MPHDKGMIFNIQKYSVHDGTGHRNDGKMDDHRGSIKRSIGR